MKLAVGAADEPVLGARVFHRRGGADAAGRVALGDVEDFEAVGVRDKSVAELQRDAGGLVQVGDGLEDFGVERVGELDDDETLVAENEGAGAGELDAVGAGENAAGVEGGAALEEVVGGVAVEQRGDAGAVVLEVRVADDDEAFVLIGDVEEAVEQVDFLLFVFRDLDAQGVKREGGWGGDGGGVFGFDVEALAELRDRGRGHVLRRVFDVDVSDIEDAEAAFAHGGVEVFAALLHVKHVFAFMLIAGLDEATAFDELLEVGRVGEALQVAALDSGRLRAFRDGYGGEAGFAVGHIDVLAHVVEEVGALDEELRHPGVVITLRGDVAVGALLGFLAAHGVRDVGAEGLAGEAGGRDGLLGLVNPVAVRVLRTDDDGAG